MREAYWDHSRLQPHEEVNNLCEAITCKSLSGNNFFLRNALFVFHVSSHDLRCGSGDSCFQKIFCMSGVSVWTLNAFYLNAAELPSHNCALFVLRLCIQICACACAFAWVLHARTSNKAWSHASYSIQQLFFFFYVKCSYESQSAVFM